MNALFQSVVGSRNNNHNNNKTAGFGTLAAAVPTKYIGKYYLFLETKAASACDWVWAHFETENIVQRNSIAAVWSKHNFVVEMQGFCLFALLPLQHRPQ